jgi:hypothetical protein
MEARKMEARKMEASSQKNEREWFKEQELALTKLEQLYIPALIHKVEIEDEDLLPKKTSVMINRLDDNTFMARLVAVSDDGSRIELDINIKSMYMLGQMLISWAHLLPKTLQDSHKPRKTRKDVLDELREASSRRR